MRATVAVIYSLCNSLDADVIAHDDSARDQPGMSRRNTSDKRVKRYIDLRRCPGHPALAEVAPFASSWHFPFIEGRYFSKTKGLPIGGRHSTAPILHVRHVGL